MQLFIMFLKKIDVLDELILKFNTHNIKGGTVVDAFGFGQSLAEMEDFPYFRLIRKYVNENNQENTKLILMAIKNDDVKKAFEISKEVIGELNKPNSAVIITLPISYYEGIME